MPFASSLLLLAALSPIGTNRTNTGSLVGTEFQEPPKSVPSTVIAPRIPMGSKFEESKIEGPKPIWPGFGLNIHFTDASDAELNLLANSGVQYVRMDFTWTATEKAQGEYNFQAYDTLVAKLKGKGIRPLFILDYGNPLYQEGAPETIPSQAAFARWAGAAAAHFKDQEILWEIWNEPNLPNFWKPQVNPAKYQSLALLTTQVMKQNDPNCRVLVGATSGLDFDFLIKVLNKELLSVVDGVSVHPYRPGGPESVWQDYGRLKGLIEAVAPEGRKDLPIISSEWGYSTFSKGVSESRQAMYLVRSWLVNAAAGVPVSIYYDWKDDGANPQENEHRFGTVTQSLKPKPSYLAMQQLLKAFSGVTKFRKVQDPDPLKWIILGAGPNTFVRASWYQKDAGLPRYDVLDISKSPKTYASMMGTDVAPQVDNLGPKPVLDPIKVLFAPPIDDEGWIAIVKKPTTDLAKLELKYTRKETGAKVTCFVNSNAKTAMEPLAMSASNSSVSVVLPGASPYNVNLSLMTFDPDFWLIQRYADNKAFSRAPIDNAGVGYRAQYTFTQGWQYFGIEPKQTLEIPEGAQKLVVWVRSDRSGNLLRSRYRDETGQVFQVDLGVLDENVDRKGMKALVIPLDGTNVSSSSGGDGSGVRKGKLYWDALLVVDSANRDNPVSGFLEFGPMAYELR